MAKSTWVQTNFNSGEWSPLAYGRFDIDKYKSGLSECLNFIPTQQGGLSRRPGTVHVAESKMNLISADTPRLVTFEFSADQSYVLEFGHYYIRFFVNGGQLLTGTVTAWATGQNYVPGDLRSSSGVSYYCKLANDSDVVAITNTSYWHPLVDDIFEIPSPYSCGFEAGTTDVWGLDFAQKADTLYIVRENVAPMKLQRRGAVDWILTEVNVIDGPYLGTNTTTTTLTPAGTSGTVAVEASSTVGINDGAGFQSTDVGRRLRMKCGGVWLSGDIATVVDTDSITWAIEDPSGQSVPTTAEATAEENAGAVVSVAVINGGGGYKDVPPEVSFSGGGGSGAAAYAVVAGGVVTAIVVGSGGSGYIAAPTVTVDPPEAIVAAATTFWRLGSWSDTLGYPSCATFHQDRLCFGGQTGYPNRIDCSATGDYENFSPSNTDGTVVDSNALSFTLNSGKLNAARWLISDEWGLLIGSAGSEWVISPSSTQQALTPTNVNTKELSNYGSADTAPVRVGKVILFVQRTKRKLREMLYQFVDSTFTAADISLVGEHLTQSGLKQMAVQFAPQQVVWIVREDGTLVGMTYDRDQKIVGWHKHVLGGKGYSGVGAPVVGSVAIIPATDNTRDEVWLTVGRYVNGAFRWDVERMSKVWEDGDAIEDSVFVDSSSSYFGAAVDTITGLDWLKGETVSVLLNGATHPDRVVSSTGTITLQNETSALNITVQVGLSYTSRAKTLTIESGGTEGPSQGKLKRIHRVVMRFFQTMGLKIHSDQYGIAPYDIPTRTDADPMDVALALYSGDRAIPYEGKWDMEGRIGFETDTPLPCNITMLMAQLDTQENS